jgi:hypothetical protein
MFGNLAKVREKFSKSKGKVQDIVRPFPDFVLGAGGGDQQFVLDPLPPDKRFRYYTVLGGINKGLLPPSSGWKIKHV